MENLMNSNPFKSVIDTGLTRVGLKSLGTILKLETPEREIKNAQSKVNPQDENINRTLNNVANNVKDLERDIFWSLYSSSPKQLEEWETPEERLANKEVINSLQESPLWDKIDTVGNSLLSSIFAKSILETIMRSDEMQEAMSQGQDGDQGEDGDGQGDGQGNPNDKPSDKKDKDGNSKAKEKAQNAMNKNNGALRASAMQKANKDAEDAETLMTGFGLETAHSTIEDYEKCVDLMNKMGKENLTGLIEMIGKVKGISASFVKANTFNPNGLICNAGMTRNIINGFCSEIAFLSEDAPEVIRDLKRLEWADRGILGMKEGVDADRTGGMIIMTDFSGSMLGHREYLAKALSLGFAQSAVDNNQKFTVQGFSTSGDDKRERMRITEKNSWIEMLDWARLSTRGGTDFCYAMEEAINNLEARENKEEYDIVFITDGGSQINDSLTQRFKECKEKYGTRLIMMKISSNDKSNLDSLVDAMVDINDRTNLEEASILLGEKLKEAHDK